MSNFLSGPPAWAFITACIPAVLRRHAQLSEQLTEYPVFHVSDAAGVLHGVEVLLQVPHGMQSFLADRLITSFTLSDCLDPAGNHKHSSQGFRHCYSTEPARLS